MRNYLLIITLFFVHHISVAQRHTIVFDKSGKIIKNYGFEKPKNKDLKFTFQIDGISEKEAGNYYLIYQWRNDYMYEANNTSEKNLMVQFKSFDKDGFTKFDKKKRKEYKNTTGEKIKKKYGSKILSYQLIKISDWAKNNLSHNSWTEMNLEYAKHYNDPGNYSALFATGTDDLNKEIDSLDILENKLKTLKKEKESNYGKDYKIDTLGKKDLINEKIEVKELQLDKLGQPGKECCLTKEIDQIITEIINLKTELQRLNFIIANKKIAHDKKIEDAKNQLSKTQKSIADKIKKGELDLSPLYISLHQGVLVSKNLNTFEIVYDTKSATLFESNRSQLNIVRLTPNLPQLTTDSDLYLHVLNLNPSDLEKDPYLLSLKTHLSAEVPIESPANFKGLENVDLGFDIEGLISEEAGLIGEEAAFTEEQKQKQKKLSNDQKKIISYTSNLVLQQITVKPNYVDYILKYPVPFEAKRKPAVQITANQFVAENFNQKMEEGELKKESYEVKYVEKVLVTDTLPPVHRLYRFSLNTGLAASQKLSYNYQIVPAANTAINELVEYKEITQVVRPLLTLSTYFFKQDLAVNPSGFINGLRTAHFDIGLDYAAKDVLDDIYVGIGFEPWRLIHIATGVKISNVEKVDQSKLDPITLDISQAMTNEMNYFWYVSVNLGLNIIPMAIGSLF